MTECANNTKSACNCKGCQEERAALQKQLEHPFYKKVDAFRDEIKQETLEKAARKYKEPFNPGSWTIEELAKHAMAENYDQSNYIYGMYERLKQLEALLHNANHTIIENCFLKREIERFKDQNKALQQELERAETLLETVKGVRFNERV